MDNCVYLQTEGELVQQSIETQHCCRVVGHCRTSLPAGLGSNVSVYTIHQARATNSKADCGSFKPFHWLKPPVAQGGTAAAAHLRMERGELVTVRSLVAAESQECTAGHHRKQQEKLVADQPRLLDIPRARSCWLAKACNLPVSVLSRCFLLTVLGTVTYWLP